MYDLQAIQQACRKWLLRGDENAASARLRGPAVVVQIPDPDHPDPAQRDASDFDAMLAVDSSAATVTSNIADVDFHDRRFYPGMEATLIYPDDARIKVVIEQINPSDLGMNVFSYVFYPYMNNDTVPSSGALSSLVVGPPRVTGQINPLTEAMRDSAGETLTTALEGHDFIPDTGSPFYEEFIIPGPQSQIGVGPGGTTVTTPMYALRFYAPIDSSPADTLNMYVSAAAERFQPRTTIPLTINGQERKLRVRSDTGPYAGQKLPTFENFFSSLLTIPLRLYGTNTLPGES